MSKVGFLTVHWLISEVCSKRLFVPVRVLADTVKSTVLLLALHLLVSF